MIGLLSGLGVVGTGIGFALRRRRQAWSTTVGRHAVTVVVTPSRKQLLVNGETVEAKTTLAGAGATLRGALPDGGEVVATVRYEGEVARVRILVDGEPVGGDDESPLLSAREPTDPRWTAARPMLADLASSADPRVRTAGARVDAGLRDVLGRLDRLGAAEATHTALGGAEALGAARTRLEERATAWLGALRELHLLALSGEGLDLGPVEETVGRLAAEAEVAEAGARPDRRVRA